MTTLVIILIVIGFIAVWIFSTYNNFVATKTRIRASIQEIGNQLKRQADMIPNLVNAVKGYMKHEKEIFKDLTDARKTITSAMQKGDAQSMVKAAETAAKALAPIQAVFESTPQLQAVGPTSQLMEELRDTADKLMYSRRTLIDLSADYNIMVVTFPSNMIANMFGFKEEVGLEMPEETKAEALTVKKENLKTPKVELN